MQLQSYESQKKLGALSIKVQYLALTVSTAKISTQHAAGYEDIFWGSTQFDEKYILFPH